MRCETNPVSREVVQPSISLSFEYFKYVLLKILEILCLWAKEIRADCLMRFILFRCNIIIHSGRHLVTRQK